MGHTDIENRKVLCTSHQISGFSILAGMGLLGADAAYGYFARPDKLTPDFNDMGVYEWVGVASAGAILAGMVLAIWHSFSSGLHLVAQDEITHRDPTIERKTRVVPAK